MFAFYMNPLTYCKEVDFFLDK